MITPMNKLPIIVNQLGRYFMRNGQVATVFKIIDKPDMTKTNFSCKGSRHRFTPTGRMVGDYDIWHPSGLNTCGESPFDLVEFIPAIRRKS